MRIGGDGPAEEGDCCRAAPALDGGETEQVEGISMIRLDGQNLAVEWLGLGQPAGLVMGDGGGEQIMKVFASFFKKKRLLFFLARRAGTFDLRRRHGLSRS